MSPPAPVLVIATAGTVALLAFSATLGLARGRRVVASLPLACFGLAFALPWLGISLHGAAAWGTVAAGTASATRLEGAARATSAVGAACMAVAAAVATVTF